MNGSDTHLNKQLEVAEVIVTARWCIASHDFLAVDCGRDRDVLTNWQAEDIIWIGQTESIAGHRSDGGLGSICDSSHGSIR